MHISQMLVSSLIGNLCCKIIPAFSYIYKLRRTDRDTESLFLYTTIHSCIVSFVFQSISLDQLEHVTPGGAR